MAVRRSTRNSTGSRRKRAWARNDEILTGVDASGQVWDLAADFNTLAGTNALPVGTTVRGIMVDFSIQAATASTSNTAGVTFGVITLDQNVSSNVPTPVTQPHADWMWWQFIGMPDAAAGASETTFRALGGPLRLGASRRIEELGTHLWGVVQTDGAYTVDIRMRTSVLLLLP